MFIQRCPVKSCSETFRKIRRKTPVPESVFFVEHLWWLLLIFLGTVSPLSALIHSLDEIYKPGKYSSDF